MNAFPDIARYFYISNLIRERVARGHILTLFIQRQLLLYIKCDSTYFLYLSLITL